MRNGAHLVVGLRIGSKLHTRLRASPLLRPRDKPLADSLAARLGYDEPALEIADSVRSATLGVRTNGHLGEANHARIALRQENRGGATCAGEERGGLPAVLVLGSLRPQRMAQQRPRFLVARSRRSDLDAQAACQSRTTRPELPVIMTSNPSRNSRYGKWWVMTGLMSRPLSSITFILYQVSYISRP